MTYKRFLAMIATSTAVMFGLMYLNTFNWDHVFWSETRFWMAFVMGASMAVIMISFMLSMYESPVKNAAIYIGSVVVFVGALYLVRSQQTIGDVAYMKAMIPHHSIAIMTSERAEIRDPRTRELAKAIITAQRREIAEMRYLIAEIEEHGVRPHSPAGAADATPMDTPSPGATDEGAGPTVEDAGSPDEGAGPPDEDAGSPDEDAGSREEAER